MVSTFTPNVQLEEPARGDDVGTWDTPVNANTTTIDLIAGGISTISAAAGSVVLSAAQFKSNNITFNSTLIASITVTFPTSFIKPYTVGNLATGSSAYVITLGTSATGGQQIALPPGEFVDVFNDGTNLKFRNLGRVGEYWDYAGSSVPAWVSGCTVPPYLNCDGSTFNSSVYPQLFVVLGSSVLPDSRGRFRAGLNQGTGRITSGSGGVDGNTRGASGGAQAFTIGTTNLPPYTPGGSVSVSGGTNLIQGVLNISVGTGGLVAYAGSPTNVTVNTGTFTGNAQGGVSTPIPEIPPAYIGGITLIRAA